MTDEKLINLLVRIAIALEKIADNETGVNSILYSPNRKLIKQSETTNEIQNEQTIQETT